MALWTPYLQDAPLDLSISSSQNVRLSPHFEVNVRGAQLPPQVFYRSYDSIRRLHTQPLPQLPQLYCGSHDPLRTCPQPSISSSSSSCESWNQLKSNAPLPSMPSPPDSCDYETESLSDDPEYQEFERESFKTMAAKNGGPILGSNPRMRRNMQTSDSATDDYRRQRERNNMAAKQSRDKRKLREARFAVQVTFLKRKVARLMAQLRSARVG